MPEQWIDARTALEIGGSVNALCSRLYAGLIRARALRLKIGDEQSQGDHLVPQKLWWAQGAAALEQDWQAGDFSTWIDRSYEVKAFGVTFALSDVLEMVEFEQRASLRRKLSVAGNADWISARDARLLAVNELGIGINSVGEWLLEQARLGFVTGRAVLAQGCRVTPDESDWAWQEREWDIAPWFWSEFSSNGSSTQDWALGKFAGKGRSPDGLRAITLSGVHFHRPTLEALGEPKTVGTGPEPAKRGRKPVHDWECAANTVWGRIYRGEFAPKNQAQVENAYIAALTVDGAEPSESTVRPYANRLWTEYSK